MAITALGDIDFDGHLVPLKAVVLVHPQARPQCFLEIEGPDGERATPIFTDHAGAVEFLESNPKFSHYQVKTLKGDVASMLDLLTIFESQGFTHVAIDSRGRHSFFGPIARLRQIIIE